MNNVLISILFLISLMGCIVAADGSGVELRPGEALAEMRFESGIGQPWVGGNPPSSGTYDSIYSQYYWSYKGSAPKKHIDSPKKHVIADSLPSTVYFSYQMQAVPYTQYQSNAAYTGGISLWILGSSSWSQYAKVPQYSGLSLLAASTKGGNGYLYEITPDGKLSKESLSFFPGSSQMDFYADTIGQHVLLFTIGGQVSNAIVIDVVNAYPQTYPATSGYPPAQVPPPATTVPLAMGDTPVTIVSQGMSGYQVFLDGNYIGTEGTGGDALDGRFSFSVIGGRNHDVRVYDGQFNYPKTMFFQKGVQKIIYVEPGTAVYI
ncbi:MAG: hypothetical protein PHQ34_12905 [Methanothrix sp.]|nr:hypothetical protein [Methanothrix sp.]